MPLILFVFNGLVGMVYKNYLELMGNVYYRPPTEPITAIGRR